MFQMCGVFAEFERAMIQERVKAGLARAKAQGKTLGRPKVNSSIEKAVLTARANGTGKRKISKKLGIGVSTVNRIITSGGRLKPCYRISIRYQIHLKTKIRNKKTMDNIN